MSNDYLVGIDEEIETKEEVENESIAPEATEYKPRPYLEWTVNDQAFKLKLTSNIITKLEKRFGDSLLNAVLEKGIPPVSVVITILQAAMQKYHHGMKIQTVEDLYDRYIESGKTQIDLLKEVIYPIMGDAGFFTRGQITEMQKEMETIDTDL